MRYVGVVMSSKSRTNINEKKILRISDPFAYYDHFQRGRCTLGLGIHNYKEKIKSRFS